MFEHRLSRLRVCNPTAELRLPPQHVSESVQSYCWATSPSTTCIWECAILLLSYVSLHNMYLRVCNPTAELRLPPQHVSESVQSYCWATSPSTTCIWECAILLLSYVSLHNMYLRVCNPTAELRLPPQHVSESVQSYCWATSPSTTCIWECAILLLSYVSLHNMYLRVCNPTAELRLPPQHVSESADSYCWATSPSTTCIWECWLLLLSYVSLHNMYLRVLTPTAELRLPPQHVSESADSYCWATSPSTTCIWECWLLLLSYVSLHNMYLRVLTPTAELRLPPQHVSESADSYCWATSPSTTCIWECWLLLLSYVSLHNMYLRVLTPTAELRLPPQHVSESADSYCWATSPSTTCIWECWLLLLSYVSLHNMYLRVLTPTAELRLPPQHVSESADSYCWATSPSTTCIWECWLLLLSYVSLHNMYLRVLTPTAELRLPPQHVSESADSYCWATSPSTTCIWECWLLLLSYVSLHNMYLRVLTPTAELRLPPQHVSESADSYCWATSPSTTCIWECWLLLLSYVSLHNMYLRVLTPTAELRLPPQHVSESADSYCWATSPSTTCIWECWLLLLSYVSLHNMYLRVLTPTAELRLPPQHVCHSLFNIKTVSCTTPAHLSFRFLSL